MFTGIVEKKAQILEWSPSRPGRSISLKVAGGWDKLALGSSVSVDGCCLTVSRRGRGRIVFDLLNETLRRTRFSSLRPGDWVNLERPLKSGQRIEGHFVLGHIDGTGKILKALSGKKEKSLLISFPQVVKNYILSKGSVAVNGVSLTIGKIEKGAFWVHGIPHTLKWTNLDQLAPGDRVNLEADALLKFWHSQKIFGSIK